MVKTVWWREVKWPCVTCSSFHEQFPRPSIQIAIFLWIPYVQSRYISNSLHNNDQNIWCTVRYIQGKTQYSYFVMSRLNYTSENMCVKPFYQWMLLWNGQPFYSSHVRQFQSKSLRKQNETRIYHCNKALIPLWSVMKVFFRFLQSMAGTRTAYNKGQHNGIRCKHSRIPGNACQQRTTEEACCFDEYPSYLFVLVNIYHTVCIT